MRQQNGTEKKQLQRGSGAMVSSQGEDDDELGASGGRDEARRDSGDMERRRGRAEPVCGRRVWPEMGEDGDELGAEEARRRGGGLDSGRRPSVAGA